MRSVMGEARKRMLSIHHSDLNQGIHLCPIRRDHTHPHPRIYPKQLVDHHVLGNSPAYKAEYTQRREKKSWEEEEYKVEEGDVEEETVTCYRSAGTAFLSGGEGGEVRERR